MSENNQRPQPKIAILFSSILSVCPICVKNKEDALFIPMIFLPTLQNPGRNALFPANVCNRPRKRLREGFQTFASPFANVILFSGKFWYAVNQSVFLVFCILSLLLHRTLLRKFCLRFK